MISNIFKKYNIDSFAFVPSSVCKKANERLFDSLPEKTNVIFALFPYYAGDCAKKMSAYGAVYDYHDFAKEVFSSCIQYVNEKYPLAFCRGYADHSPFLECCGAAAAGLGVIGKHSLLISEKYSSYVFIGELVTTLTKQELENEGVKMGDCKISYCIGCNACISACPAGCAGSGDRSLCASAVTQKKGELTNEETEIMKSAGSIWGCDTCQYVCPYTKKALERGSLYTPIEFFKSSYIGDSPEKAIPKMDDETFRRYPFAWRKRKTVERNVSILYDERTEE